MGSSSSIQIIVPSSAIADNQCNNGNQGEQVLHSRSIRVLNTDSISKPLKAMECPSINNPKSVDLPPQPPDSHIVEASQDQMKVDYVEDSQMSKEDGDVAPHDDRQIA